MTGGTGRLRRGLGVLAALLWTLGTVTGVIRWIAGDAKTLEAEMLRQAPPASTGLPEREYPGMAEMIAGYLTGRIPEFQYEFEDDQGRRYKCFQAHEAEHMADCRGLIALDETVCLVCLPLAAAATALGARRRRDRRDFAAGIRRSLTGLGLAATGLLAWALVNFDGLFITFHRVAFPRGGWLLDPRTDLLIRLMPERFFTALGARGLGLSLIAPAALLLAARAMGRGGERKDQDDV